MFCPTSTMPCLDQLAAGAHQIVHNDGSKPFDGLIKQEDLWVAHQCTGYSQHLLFAP